MKRHRIRTLPFMALVMGVLPLEVTPLVLAAFFTAGDVAATQAQEMLACGVPVQRQLNTGGTDAYRVQVTAGSMVSVDVRDVTGVLGLIRLRALGPDGTQETCAGTIMLSAPGETTVEVSDCLGTDRGDYTITASVVAATADNCGVALPCGAYPSVFFLSALGEVDSFTFDGRAGDRVTLRAVDLSGSIGFVRQQVFDPDGIALTGADSCATATRTVTLAKSGVHTVLVSACGLPKTGLYGISVEPSSCPAGPQITYFGIARPDGLPLTPDAYDNLGRGVYKLKFGSGFYLVVEARPGASGAGVGLEAFTYDPQDPTVLPDFQMLISQPLGNASPEVCDKQRPDQGGVPATVPLEFAETQTVADAINDLGCRVDDGTGTPQGIGSIDACTQFLDGSSHFVEASSTLQFCMPIAAAWSFAPGTTVLKARVRDRQRVLGAARELVVRVGDDIVPCPSDCNRDSEVTVNELVSATTITLNLTPLDVCPPADTNHDFAVTIDELLAAVNAALNGCPA